MPTPLVRFRFQAAALGMRMAPSSPFVRRTEALLPQSLQELPEEVVARAGYYNRLQPVDVPRQPRLRDLPLRKKSMPRADLMRVAKGFGPDLRGLALLGDEVNVPEQPTLLKSRPICPVPADGSPAANANSVVMPLDMLRHFAFHHDPFDWSQKRPTAVWRGRLGRLQDQPERIAALRLYHDDPAVDIGQVNARDGFPPPRGWLSERDQMQFRYILALEGNDVASNLKWVMNSNSVALSPPLKYETWFMEGQLLPDVHFIGLAPDMSDLHDKITWAEANPAAVAQIRRNAHAWVQRFADPRREAQVAALVLQKYVEATGGQAHSRIRRQLFFPAP